MLIFLAKLFCLEMIEKVTPMNETRKIYEDILQPYEKGPDQLEEAIAGLGESDLDLARSPDSWTIRQLVHHIVDGDDLWKVHIKAALGNGQGVFNLMWYWEIPQDLWVQKWNYADREIKPSLVLFRANRQHVVQLIERIPDACERSICIQWLNGQKEQCSVGSTLRMQAGHTIGHIGDILAIRRIHRL